MVNQPSFLRVYLQISNYPPLADPRRFLSISGSGPSSRMPAPPEPSNEVARKLCTDFGYAFWDLDLSQILIISFFENAMKEGILRKNSVLKISLK